MIVKNTTIDKEFCMLILDLCNRNKDYIKYVKLTILNSKNLGQNRRKRNWLEKNGNNSLKL